MLQFVVFVWLMVAFFPLLIDTDNGGQTYSNLVEKKKILLNVLYLSYLIIF